MQVNTHGKLIKCAAITLYAINGNFEKHSRDAKKKENDIGIHDAYI